MNKNADEVIVMNCPYCNFPNSPDSRFCENCGAPLPPIKNKSHTGLIAVITIVILAAIGGITADRVPELQAAGAAGACLRSSLMLAPDPAAELHPYQEV